MCTVSFIVRQRGYLLGMNRDEQLSRVPGLPPGEIPMDGRLVVCPSEPGCGTWISLNDTRVAFALVNWYSIKSRIRNDGVSRGTVVRAVAAQISQASASRILSGLPLKRVNPFRLIGVFPAQARIWEWRWNQKALACVAHPWKSRQWISSGYDEPAAQCQRSRTFERARGQKGAGSRAWLRRLPRSHVPERGPFSICMHRADAATVSYTEISVSGRRTAMAYWAGAPCQ